MSEFHIGDDPVLSGTIVLPRVGAWHADLVVDIDTAPTGSVTLEIASGDNTVQLVGHAVRSDVFQLQSTVRLVGGAGGFSGDIDARYYSNVQARTILNDLIRDAGETLSSTASSDVQSQQVGQWARLQGPAGLALTALLRRLDASWRVLTDGTVWVGVDDYGTTLDLEFDLLAVSPGENRVTIATDVFPDTLVPGTVFMDKNVSAVMHEFSDTKTRTKVWFEDAAE